jgi:CRP/FNR family cyclic AMP-dependent transcriptional regulator
VLRKNARIELLRGVPLFARCSKADLAHIGRISEEVAFPEGTVLIEEGRQGREFFVVLEGKLAVSREARRVAEVGPGDYVGEMALLSNAPRNATVTALTPVRLLAIGDRAFLELLDQAPYLWHKIAAGLADRIEPDALWQSGAR